MLMDESGAFNSDDSADAINSAACSLQKESRNLVMMPGMLCVGKRAAHLVRPPPVGVATGLFWACVYSCTADGFLPFHSSLPPHSDSQLHMPQALQILCSTTLLSTHPPKHLTKVLSSKIIMRMILVVATGRQADLIRECQLTAMQDERKRHEKWRA